MLKRVRKVPEGNPLNSLFGAENQKDVSMGLMQELSRLKSFIEGNLLSYILDRFPLLKDGSEFHLCKRIEVETPFGNINTRNNDGKSQMIPEFCIISTGLSLCAEAAAWDDDKPSAEKERSEAHNSMHKIGLKSDSIYFAQKVMCQIYPAYLYCKTKSTNCYAFLSFTQNHEEKMIYVLSHLKERGFLQSFIRPSGTEDLRKYYQMIYELQFPECTECITKMLNTK